jgi:hypothetical protein
VQQKEEEKTGLSVSISLARGFAYLLDQHLLGRRERKMMRNS